MLFEDQIATATDVAQLLGDVAPRAVARILAIAPTRDELVRAARQGGDDDDDSPSSARIASIRRVLTHPDGEADTEVDA